MQEVLEGARVSLPKYLEELADVANGQAVAPVFGVQTGTHGVITVPDDSEALMALEQGEMGSVAVLRPRLCQRKGVFFVAARQWFAPAKLQGVQMMKAAKDTIDDKTARNMAADLALVIRLCFESSEGAVIAAPSPRHSAFAGLPHFASLIAEHVAEEIGTRSASLFEITKADRKGHHPAREKEPPKVIVQNLPRDRRVILIDDVATSGQTLEWHAKALREQGVKVSTAVWVYGSTSGVGR